MRDKTLASTISGFGLKRLMGRSLPNMLISSLGRADGRKKISGQDGRRCGDRVVPLRLKVFLLKLVWNCLPTSKYFSRFYRSQIEVCPICKLNEDWRLFEQKL